MKHFVSVACAALMLGAASVAAVHADGLKDPKDVKISFVVHGNPSDAYWSVVKRGVEDAAKLTGAQVQYLSPQVFDEVEHAAELTPAARYLGQFVSINGLRLHYVSKGAGKPIVFIHGNPGSHHDFSGRLIGELTESHRVFVFDRPGHGYSGRYRRGATVETQAALLHEAMSRLGIEKPLVVGHSWGGSLALALALQYESDFSGLVLLAPAAYPSKSSEWWTVLPPIPVLGNFLLKVFAPLIGRSIVKASLKEAYHPQPVPPDYLEQATALWTRPAQVMACARDDRSLNASLEQMSSRYSSMRLPVVIVTGDSDLLVKPEDHAKRLHQTIKGSRLISVEHTGHQLPQTRPDRVVEAIQIAWELAENPSLNPERPA